MRSQSVAMVLPYDVFLFAFLHCWVAEQVGVPAGHYQHVMSSANIYEDEIEVASQILQSDPQPVSVGDFAESDKRWPELIERERILRKAAENRDVSGIRSVAEQINRPATTVYEQTTAILAAFAAASLGREDLVERSLKYLDPNLRALFLARAPAK